jgi:hypothetical protein
MFALCHTLFLYYVGATKVLQVRGDQAEFLAISLILLSLVSMLAGMIALGIGLM